MATAPSFSRMAPSAFLASPVFDGNDPGVGVVRPATHTDVAPDVNQGARIAVQLGHRCIDCRALRDPTQVHARANGTGHLTSIHPYVAPAEARRLQQRHTRVRTSPHLLEGAVVAQREQVVQHDGIEKPIAEPCVLQAAGQEIGELLADAHALVGRLVEEAQLALGAEARVALLVVIDLLYGTREGFRRRQDRPRARRG